jgi:hypothetical protein
MILDSFKTTQTKSQELLLGIFFCIDFLKINSFFEAAQLSFSRNIPPAPLYLLYFSKSKKTIGYRLDQGY